MHHPPPTAALRITHSILAADVVAEQVGQHYDIAPVADCYLLRRAFNEAYLVQAKDGAKYVARLSARRARGPANLDYEVALLAHLAGRGVAVATALPTAAGASSVVLALPEGERPLALFTFIDGDMPETLPDMTFTGAGLARIHAAAQDYAGPPSRYTLDVDHLLRRPLGWLMQAPTLDDALRDDFRALADEIGAAVLARTGLSRVACHGDCHGGNNHVRDDGAGGRVTAFFDFDDAGPGYLAYDLGVFLWSQLMRKGQPAPDTEVLARWQAFLQGYAGQREIPAPDLAAVPLFVAMRHLWLLGEFASRRHQWGSQVLPVGWLRKQATLIRAWRDLQLPPWETEPAG